ncbi:MAG: hypothetical protein QOD06_678 [Candidatus Binatota bacterium]|jgi:2-hydroxychromene-2-carboxylate isomerase|nr:hypothetical protein [Candidatus Binatota bacterium]
MPPTPIRFYFDYISPNAYLAWTQLPRLAEKYGRTVEPVPILYAALLDANGQLGPGEMPAKGRWMAKNNLRKAALVGVTLNPPAFLPFNPLLALRVTTVALGMHEGTALISALFEAVWVHGMHLSESGVVERVASDAGLDGARLVAEADDPEIKAELRRRTDEAIALGVFGVPTVVAGDDLFWGYDDFPQLEMVLAGKDPVTPAVWQKWTAPVPASASRRRFRS